MNSVAMDFRSELSVSPKPVLLALVAMGPSLYTLGEVLGLPRDRLELFIPFVFITYALVAASWLLQRWFRLAGRWSTVIALAATIWLGSGWLRIPGFLALLPLPVMLATTLLGPHASVIIALAETTLTLLLPHLLLPGSDATTSCTILVAMGGAWGIAYATVRPVHQLCEWLAEYFVRAQRALEQARDRKVQLEQTLQAFAHANRQLALANEHTAALRSIAEEAQRVKAAFVANVSHELRTPLNMITGLVELMVKNPEIYTVTLSPKMRKDLETVYRNCEHLSNMINDVLDLSRVEAGRLPLHRELVSLQDVVTSTVVVVRPLLESKRLSLQIAVPQDLPLVYCDRTRIEQVILNLLSNAARHTVEGRIEVEAVCKGQEVLVRVTDTGPGLQAEDARRIFEPFCQASSARRDRGGSGLGLSISKQLVELHGGKMWLESAPGAGATFFFTLPISPPIEHMVHPWHSIREDWVWREQALKSQVMAQSEQLLMPRLVVVDKDDALYPQLIRYADEIEFVLAREAAGIGQSLQECPAHAVLLNATDPQSAWPLAWAASQEAPGIPVIVCSVPREAQRAVQSGAAGYLVKPVTRADLERAVRSAGRPVRRVLVVDDDPDALGLFGTMLQVCDRTLVVDTAASGKQALAQMRDCRPDLVLLDIVMPDMDGWQVLEAMAKDEELRNVLTYLVSAQDPAEQPPRSRFVLATIGGGLSLAKLIGCSLTLSSMLLQPDSTPDPTPL